MHKYSSREGEGRGRRTGMNEAHKHARQFFFSFSLVSSFSSSAVIHFAKWTAASRPSFPVCLRKSSTFRIISYCQSSNSWPCPTLMHINLNTHTLGHTHVHIYMCAMFFLWENFMKMLCKLNENILTMRWQWQWRCRCR